MIKPTSLFISAALAVAGGPFASAGSQPSPAAYWTMDAISNGVLLDQAHLHDALVPQLIGQKDSKSSEILPDFAPTVEKGIKGNALAFAKEQQGFLDVSDPKAFDFTKGLTVSLWVKVESANAMMNLFSCAEDIENPSGGWTLSYSYGDVVFRAVDKTGKWITANLRKNFVAADSWVHIAAVADATTLRLFLNGVETASKAFNGPIKLADTPLVIGNHATIAGWRHSDCPAFSGLMDEVKIFEKPLTAAEVQAESESYLTPGTVPVPKK
jgi:hypothetical protein